MSENPQPKTILAVDDHELVRVGMRQVIGQHFADRFEMAEANSLEQALLFLKHRTEEVLLILLDLNLGDTRGLAGLQLLRKLYPGLPVFVVSGTHDPRVREEVLSLGARGYFRKTGESGDLDGLLAAIERVAANPGVALGGLPGKLDARAHRDALKLHDSLSPRQIQVLELLLRGLDNSAIAQETGLALGSVKNCVSSIFLVFNVRSRAELIGVFS